MRKTREELATHIRGLDMLKCSTMDIGAWLQAFGQSARGTREELIERLYHIVWRKEYDT